MICNDIDELKRGCTQAPPVLTLQEVVEQLQKPGARTEFLQARTKLLEVIREENPMGWKPEPKQPLCRLLFRVVRVVCFCVVAVGCSGFLNT